MYIVVLCINLKTFVRSHPFVVPFSFSSLLPMYHSFDGGLLFAHMYFDIHRNKCLDFEIASLFVISVEWRIVYYWWIINFIAELWEWRFLNLRHNNIHCDRYAHAFLVIFKPVFYKGCISSILILRNWLTIYWLLTTVRGIRIFISLPYYDEEF